MSRQLVTGLLVAAAVACASLAAASVPDPATSSVSWGGPFNGACTFPVICPRGGASPDIVATINVIVRDQFGSPMGGIGASEVEATGTCILGGGSPCGLVINVLANAATAGDGSTTISISKAGSCCADLQVRARGTTLNTLSYRSYDYTGDLRCDLSDLGFLAQTFNLSQGQGGYNACFDFDCNNKVDLSDLGFFAPHFNHIC